MIVNRGRRPWLIAFFFILALVLLAIVAIACYFEQNKKPECPERCKATPILKIMECAD